MVQEYGPAPDEVLQQEPTDEKKVTIASEVSTARRVILNKPDIRSEEYAVQPLAKQTSSSLANVISMSSSVLYQTRVHA